MNIDRPAKDGNGDHLKHGTSVRKWIIVCWVLVCALIIFVQFFPPRIGAANNGDFIRLAGRVGIDGNESFTTDAYPYFYKLYEKWVWKPFDWRLLTPQKASLGNVFPILLIRAITNAISDTAAVPFSTVYLAIVYTVMLAAACYMLIRFSVIELKLHSIWIILTAIVMLFGSMHLAWLNSFYGEAMLYVGLLLLCGCIITAIYAPRCSFAGKSMSIIAIFCSHLFLTAKPQAVIGYPIWMALISCLCFFHFPLFENHQFKKTAVCWLLAASILLFLSGSACYQLYAWNVEYNEKDTLYSAVMDGVLTLSSNPERMLQEMGLDPVLAQDKGKQAYGNMQDKFLVPGTKKAEDELYSKIDTIGLLKYYCMHPVYLYQALEITANYAAEPPVSLLRYICDEDTITAKHSDRFAIWQRIRPYITPHHFWQYAAIYIILLSICIWQFFTSKGNARKRLLIGLYVTILLTGILQYPLPFIGNGHADTNKQLYLFMLTYDMAILGGLGWVLAAWRNRKSVKKA